MFVPRCLDRLCRGLLCFEGSVDLSERRIVAKRRQEFKSVCKMRRELAQQSVTSSLNPNSGASEARGVLKTESWEEPYAPPPSC